MSSDESSAEPANSNPTNLRTYVVYESAIDVWVLALLLLSPVGAFVIGVALFAMGRSDEAAVIFATGAFTALVTVACTLPCRYTLLDDALSTRCGVLFSQVAYQDITSVEKSASWRSGPALSMRRVAVKTSGRILIVSPKDRDAFITDLRTRMEACDRE